MVRKRTALTLALLAGCLGPAAAFPPDGCKQQRAQYPANWNDTSREKPLFICESQQDRFRVKLGATDAAGRTLMSLVPFDRNNGAIVETGQDVLRIWLDQEQTQRLHDGKYFATIVRKENSCWIRGSLEEDTVFLMDNAHPPADKPDEAGSFYSKAPRFSAYGSSYVLCEPVK